MIRRGSPEHVIVVGFIAVILAIVAVFGLSGCDDGRHSAPRVCKVIAQASCVPDAGKYGYGTRCGLMAADGSRYNGHFSFPVMAGDRVCDASGPQWDDSGKWSEVRP